MKALTFLADVAVEIEVIQITVSESVWKSEQTGGLDVVSVHTTVYCIVTFITDLEVPT